MFTPTGPIPTAAHEPPTPFRIDIAQSEIDDLHERLARTRWPHRIPGSDDATDFTSGVPLGYLRQLADYWRNDFDWRAQERALNAHEQVTIGVEGQPFHVVHARSRVPGATPLLLNHGWPGSFVEYARIIDSLVDPCAHGGDEADAFHVVIPSPPGFGFSTPLAGTGWEVARTSSAYAEIMTQLGYERFATHGTDTGAGVALRLGATLPERVIGVHVGSDGRALAMVGDKYPRPEDFGQEEMAEVERVRHAEAGERGYYEVQNHRPATIGAALTDSPVGQLAWIVEKFQAWTGGSHRTPDEAVDLDQLLTNVSLYWFTRAGASSARFY